MKQAHIVYLGVGSNAGDRESLLLEAQKRLNAHEGIEILDHSSIYETEPWPKHEVKNGRGLSDQKQERHLNQVLKIHTTLLPRLLLNSTQSIETKMGKLPKKKWGSRLIDIDILLYEDLILNETDLKLPHLFMTDRQFVLVPLLEIDPGLIDPRTGRRYQDFLDELPHAHQVERYDGESSSLSLAAGE